MLVAGLGQIREAPFLLLRGAAYMVLVLMLLAAAADPPKKLMPIFSANDYPVEAQRKGQQGQVVADMLINPAGGVETCTVVLSSGYRELDDGTCSILYQRAQFIPAKDGAGNPMYSVVRTPPISWSLGSFRSVPVPPDYDIMINRAPDGIQLPIEFAVRYLVTREGEARNCVLVPGRTPPTGLVALACQAVAAAQAQIIRNRQGVPVEAAKNAMCRFSLDDGQDKKKAAAP